ncbi:MAG: macro domain-containing protein [Candidatus Sumerlaeia bacterium]|nr:macro domain-containing protein [Candidatus Sumerlaeia bacterium]
MPEIIIGKMDLGNGRTFIAVESDLLAETTDCIVNAANGMLVHGGGVAAVIARAAGRSLVEECNQYVRQHGMIAVGEAIVTSAGNLPFKGVIHAVGPMLGDGNEETKLAQAVKSALLRAHERGWSSLSFPAISSGIFRVPPVTCARAYVKGVREFNREYPHSPLKTIRLCVFKGPIVEAVKAEMGV